MDQPTRVCFQSVCVEDCVICVFRAEFFKDIFVNNGSIKSSVNRLSGRAGSVSSQVVMVKE